MIKKEKSHIFIAKGVLKRFEDKNRLIHYIRNDYKEIFTARSKSYNTELGYYSNKNEDILNVFSEDKFLKLISTLTKSIDNNMPLNLTSKDRTTILKYLAYQILRNDYIYEQINDKFKTNINSAVMKNILVNIESEKNIFWNTVKDCNVELMINTTKNKFLLPITSTISLNSNSENDYVFILFVTPKIAFNFYSSKLFQEPIMTPIYINEHSAKDMNLKILYLLKNEKINDIIGLKEDLEKAIKSFKNKEKTIL